MSQFTLKTRKELEVEDPLDQSIAVLNLEERTANALEEREIFTVRNLLMNTRHDLLAIPGFGETCLEDVYKALARIGYHREVRKPVQQNETPVSTNGAHVVIPNRKKTAKNK